VFGFPGVGESLGVNFRSLKLWPSPVSEKVQYCKGSSTLVVAGANGRRGARAREPKEELQVGASGGGLRHLF